MMYPGRAARRARAPFLRDGRPESVTRGPASPIVSLATLLLVVVATGPSGVRAEIVPCAGQTLVAVAFEGCEGTRCADEEARAALGALVGVAPGTPWDEPAVRAGVGRLVATRFFHAVDVRCEAREGGTVLVLVVNGTWTVRDVEIEGNQFFYESDIRKRVFLRPGTVLDPRPEQLRADEERQAESIRRLYAREGFARAAVTVTVVRGEAGEATVRVQVDEGPKDRVGDVEVVIARDPEVPERVGCPNVTPADVRSAAEVSRGDIFTPLVARRARKRTLAMLRLRGYVAPEVALPSFDADRQRLTLRIALGRCYDLAFYRRTEATRWGDGWQRSWDDQLAESLPFAESGALDEEEAEYGRQALEQVFEARGHLFADVRLDFRDFRVDRRGPDHPADVLGAVHYYITEDEPLEIRDVRIHGVAAFEEDRVRGWMETRAYDFFGEGGYLQVQRLLWDLAAVQERYRDAGFLRFAFRGCEDIVERGREWERARGDRDRDDTRAGAEDDGRHAGRGEEDDERIQRRVWRHGGQTLAGYAVGDTCFRVVREEGEASVRVHVFVEEGPRSRIGAVRVDGLARLEEDAAREALDLQRGAPFSARQVAEAVQRLRRAYHKAGVYPIEVDVGCEARDPVIPPEFCRLDRVAADEVSLTLTVREGTPRVVGQRFVRGDFRTADWVVLRDLPEVGEPYDEERILDGVRKLRDLGVFESIKVTPIGLEETPPRREIGLLVDVEESEARFVDLAVGFETLNRDEQTMPEFLTRTLSDGLGAADQRTAGFGEGPLIRLPDLLITLEASYVHRNFLGWAKELYIPLKYGLSTTEFNRLASFKPTWLDSRFLGYELLFRLTPFVVYDRATQALDEFEYGFQTEISKQLTPALYGSLSYELSRIQVRNPREEGAEFGPFTLQNKVSPRLSYDRTDHPLHPLKGWYLGATLSYINALQEANFENFLKWELAAKAYVSLRATVVFALFVHYGGSYSFDGTDLPLDERYRLLLRGFADDTVGQYDDNGDLKLRTTANDAGDAVLTALPPGGDHVLNGTVEIRFPIVRRLDLWLAGFFDWGALEEDLRDLQPKSFRMSAGLGIRWLAGGQIPIRIDYGFVIDPRCKSYDVPEGGATDRSQLICVPEDLGTLHFGVLYTF